MRPDEEEAVGPSNAEEGRHLGYNQDVVPVRLDCRTQAAQDGDGEKSCLFVLRQIPLQRVNHPVRPPAVKVAGPAIRPGVPDHGPPV